MSTDDGILTVSEAEKRLAEIVRLKAGKTPDVAKAEALGGQLAAEISRTIEIHSDRRTRGLMAVLRKLRS